MSPDDPVPDPERTAQDNREPAAEVGAHSDAVSALFRQKDYELKSYLARRLGSAEEAQDVAQEAYARLLALDRPDAPSSLHYRLWAIAKNLATDRLRLRATRGRISPVALCDPHTSAP